MTAPCTCRCHAGGAHVSCDRGPIQPGGHRSCTWLHNDDNTAASDPPDGCGRCGAPPGQRHTWVEGDCVLPHRAHSRNLHPGTHVCRACTEHWDQWLTETADLYAILSTVLHTADLPTGRPDHQHGRKAPSSPSPVNLTAWALLHGPVNDHIVDVDIDPDGRRVRSVRQAYLGGHLPDIPATLAAWTEAIWDAQGWGTDWPTTVSGAVAALRANLTTIAAMPDCDTFDAELRWIRRALHAAHGITDPQPLGECLTVDCAGLVWRQTTGARCDRCERHYGRLDLIRLRVQRDISRAAKRRPTRRA